MSKPVHIKSVVKDVMEELKGRKMYFELAEDEAEFVAAELHQRYLDMDEGKKRKALRIGNKLAEQLFRKRLEKQEGRKL